MFLFSLTEQRVVRALLQALIKSFLFKYSSHYKFCLHTIDYYTHWATPPSDEAHEAAAANPKKTRYYRNMFLLQRIRIQYSDAAAKGPLVE